MLFWEEIKGFASPPSYTEAVHLPPPGRLTTPGGSQGEEPQLKPKLCKMQKSSVGYGFHVNGILGQSRQHIEQVTPPPPPPRGLWPEEAARRFWP